MVSVPYRGATFLNVNMVYVRFRVMAFPSPIGELHFSIRYNKDIEKQVIGFPSPIGELHFSIVKRNKDII